MTDESRTAVAAQVTPRSRHRWRLVAVAAAVVLATGGLAGYRMFDHRERLAGENRGPVATIPTVGSAVAGDATHVYATLGPTSSSVGKPCQPRLLAGELRDGQWHWRTEPLPGSCTIFGASDSPDTARTPTAKANAQLVALGPATLLAFFPRDEPAEQVHASTDGGRSWREVTVATLAPGTVPPGWRPVANPAPFTAPDGPPPRVLVADPVTGQVGALANPPLTNVHAVPTVLPGEIRVAGADPATGKPATAVSRDGSRTWSVHVFTEGLAPNRALGPARPAVVFGSSPATARLGYAAVEANPQPLLYRTTDGAASWQLVAPFEAGGSLVVLGDGSLLGHKFDRDQIHRQVSRDGGATFAPVQLAGLPTRASRFGFHPYSGALPEPAPGAGFVAYDEGSVLLSPDGWTWQRIGVPGAGEG